MLNKINLIGQITLMASVFVTLSFCQAHSECTAYPTCENLGYKFTAKECDGLKALKCPFGDFYFCDESTRIFSCSDGGYKSIQQFGTTCRIVPYKNLYCYECGTCESKGEITCSDGTCGMCCLDSDCADDSYKCDKHTCVSKCTSSQKYCNNKCIAKTDCCETCGSTQHCSNGQCVNGCASGKKLCNGKCISQNECCGGCPSDMQCSSGTCVYTKDCVTPCNHYRSKPTIGVICYDRCYNGCIGSDPAWAKGDHTAMGQRCD